MAKSFYLHYIWKKKETKSVLRAWVWEWHDVPAGVPQGAKLGPWLFIIMINEIDILGFELWKYVDYFTISEAILKGQQSNIQTAVGIFASCAASDKFQLKEAKCKELRICFSTNGFPDLNSIVINDKQIDVVSHAKILGANISSDLKLEPSYFRSC